MSDISEQQLQQLEASANPLVLDLVAAYRRLGEQLQQMRSARDDAQVGWSLNIALREEAEEKTAELRAENAKLVEQLREHKQYLDANVKEHDCLANKLEVVEAELREAQQQLRERDEIFQVIKKAGRVSERTYARITALLESAALREVQ